MTDEYISKEKVLDIITSKEKDYQNDWGAAEIAQEIKVKIRQETATDVQPVKHGKWTWDSNAPHREHGAYKCSNCGCHSYFEENYCYNCGVRMDGDVQ